MGGSDYTSTERQRRYRQRMKENAQSPDQVLAALGRLQPHHLQHIMAEAERLLANAPLPGPEDVKSRCSFCSKVSTEVKALIKGDKALICDECVDLCADTIAKHTKMQVADSEPPEPILAEPATVSDGIVADREQVLPETLQPTVSNGLPSVERATTVSNGHVTADVPPLDRLRDEIQVLLKRDDWNHADGIATRAALGGLFKEARKHICTGIGPRPANNPNKKRVWQAKVDWEWQRLLKSCGKQPGYAAGLSDRHVKQFTKDAKTLADSAKRD